MIKELFFACFFESWIFDPNCLFCKGYSLCMMADFQNRLISRIFGVFSSGLLQKTTLTWLKNLLSHVFLNVNFWPKLTDHLMAKGYSPNMIKESFVMMLIFANFQNRLISRRFGVFSIVFLHRTSLTWLKNRFLHVFFLILIFDPNWLFCKGYSPCMMADFQNRLISRSIWCFLNRFFAQNNSNMIKESFFCMFFWIWIFDPNWLFCKGYSLCMMADFQNRLISRIFGVFSSGLLQKTTLTWLKNLLSHVFLNVNFWAKLTILQRLQPLHDGHFQNRLISQIFGVFSIGFLHRTSLTLNRFFNVFLNLNFWPKLTILQRLSLASDFQDRFHLHRTFCVFSIFLHRTSLWLKNRFLHVFWILIFDPNWLFCKGYSLCMMADFQNRLISRIFGVLSSGSFAENNSNMIKESFVACFLEC